MEHHELDSGRTLSLFQGSITEVGSQAVVTAANTRLAGGGGVDGAVHAAAGPRLLAACQRIQADPDGRRCPPGQARLTPGYDLCEFVIHAVGPIWSRTDPDTARRLLRSAYEMAFFLAGTRDVRSLAVPSLSTGAYGFPLEEAAPIAVDRAVSFLEQDQSVHELVFALFDREAFGAFQRAVASRV